MIVKVTDYENIFIYQHTIDAYQVLQFIVYKPNHNYQHISVNVNDSIHKTVLLCKSFWIWIECIHPHLSTTHYSYHNHKHSAPIYVSTVMYYWMSRYFQPFTFHVYQLDCNVVCQHCFSHINFVLFQKYYFDIHLFPCLCLCIIVSYLIVISRTW